MKVKELMKKLVGVNPNAEVFISFYCGGSRNDISSIDTKKEENYIVIRYKN